jgi:hypothetical protein
VEVLMLFYSLYKIITFSKGLPIGKPFLLSKIFTH